MSLLAERESLTDESFRNIWSTHVVMHSGVGSLTGRTLNMNRFEESSAHQFLAQHDIEQTFQRTLRSFDALTMLRNYKIVIKIPDVAFELTRTSRVFPGMTTVATIRHPAGVVRSLKERGWYQNPDLADSGLALPVRMGSFGPVPYWLASLDEESWYTGSEDDRCLLNYIWTSDFTANRPSFLLNYEEMIKTSGANLKELTDEMGARESSMSLSIRKSISQGKPIPSFGDTANPNLVERAMSIWEQVRI